MSLQELNRQAVSKAIRVESNACRRIVRSAFDDCLRVLKRNQSLIANEEGQVKLARKEQENLVRLKESVFERLGFGENINYEKRSELR